MKRLKKASIIFLMFMLLSVIAMPVSASAAKLNKKSISLNVGKTYTLKATGTKGKITWISSNKSVATVSSKGVVKARKKGTAVITAKYGKKKLACKVTVKQPVTSLKLNKKAANITVGEKITLKATVSPTTANNKTVIWKSSNTSVATVSSKGVVVGKKRGTVTITATAKDGSKKKASCKVTVKAAVTNKKDYYKTVPANAENFKKYFSIFAVRTKGSLGIIYAPKESSDGYYVYGVSDDFAGDEKIETSYSVDFANKPVDPEILWQFKTCKTVNASYFMGSDRQEYIPSLKSIKISNLRGNLKLVHKDAIVKIENKYDSLLGLSYKVMHYVDEPPISHYFIVYSGVQEFPVLVS